MSIITRGFVSHLEDCIICYASWYDRDWSWEWIGIKKTKEGSTTIKL